MLNGLGEAVGHLALTRESQLLPACRRTGDDDYACQPLQQLAAEVVLSLVLSLL
ncbi:hypothetical protein [Streptomyces collinus]|uniref:hypothetical protein n=1 Tax=Streptomyces collinus TaxID=42684 RepID=UPI00294321AF|nr:hypothetical protein [Streptomyces collinus]